MNINFRLIPVVACLIPATLLAGQLDTSCKVSWSHERLSVTAERTPLSEVVDRVAGKIGIEVRGIESLRGEATVHFSEIPLRVALGRLLGKTSYALIENPPDAARARFVLVIVGQSPNDPDSSSASRSNPASDSTAANQATVRSANELGEAAQNGDLGTLRRAARTGEGTEQAVALRLLSERDPEEARAVALTSSRSSNLDTKLNGLQVLGEIDDPESTAALGAALKDPALAVRQAAVTSLLDQTGPEAVRFLSLATKDQDPSIRMQAIEFLAQKKAQGDAGPQ